MMESTVQVRLLAAVAIVSMGAVVSCSKSADPPDIELPTDHFDMGEIQSDVVAEELVTIYNRGASPLVIEKITTTCHCTEGVMVDSTIPAGGEGTMRVTVDPLRFKGRTSTQTLTIVSNDPDEAMIEMEVSATALPGLEYEPSELEFGTVPEGEGAERRVRIRQLQNTPLELRSDFLRSSDYVLAVYEEVPSEERSDPEKLEFDLVVTILPTAPAGAYSRVFSIIGNTREGLQTVPMNAIVGEDGEAPTE